MDRTSKLLSDGYKVYDSCYENADSLVDKAKKQGYKDVKVQRVKTDTKGIKMFLVWVLE